jgi:hypothetical protein
MQWSTFFIEFSHLGINKVGLIEERKSAWFQIRYFLILDNNLPDALKKV